MDHEIVETARWLGGNTTGRFRRKMLNQLLWYSIEKDGKYTTRFAAAKRSVSRRRSA